MLGCAVNMVEEKNESTRNLLEQIEGEWDSPEPGEPRKAPSPEIQAALDAAADRLTESLDPPPISVPTMDELDSGWGDEDDDDDDDEDDEIEPELPDERLDPVAYAAAKKARDERIEAKRQRRRLKVEAKKARRKARLDAQKQKQKGKQKKSRNPAADAAKAKATAKAEAKAARNAARAAAARAGASADAGVESDDADDDVAVIAPARARGKAPPSKVIAKGGLSKTNQWMLAIAIVIFVAAAIFAAVVAR